MKTLIFFLNSLISYLLHIVMNKIILYAWFLYFLSCCFFLHKFFGYFPILHFRNLKKMETLKSVIFIFLFYYCDFFFPCVSRRFFCLYIILFMKNQISKLRISHYSSLSPFCTWKYIEKHTIFTFIIFKIILASSRSSHTNPNIFHFYLILLILCLQILIW